MGPGDIVKLFRKRILEHTGYGKYVNKNGDICNELLSADWIEVFVTHVARGFEIKEGFCVISFVIKRDGAARV